jgi:hypothetical protein
LGTSALALACWLWARRSRSVMSAVVLGASIFLAVSSHYYSVLAPLPLMMAQAVDDFRRRRIAWRIWIAFSAGALPILASLPLIRGQRAYAAHFWSPPQLIQMIDLFDVIIGPEVGPILAVALIAVLCARHRVHCAGSEPELPEWVALWGFVALPVVAWLLAVFVTHGYVIRYTMQPVIGIAVLFGLGLGRRFGAASRVALLCAMAMCVVALVWSGFRVSDERGDRAGVDEIPQLVDAVAPGPMPVAVSTVDLWLRLDHYHPTSKRARYFTYLSDPELALRHMDHNVTEVLLQSHPEIYPDTLRRFGDFVGKREAFLVFSAQPDWVSKELLARRWSLRVLGRATQGVLYLAEPGTQ